MPFRDIEHALVDATGDRLLSRTVVSQVTEVLWVDYQAFVDCAPSGFKTARHPARH